VPLVTVLAVGLGVALTGFGPPASPDASTNSLGVAADASRATLSSAAAAASRVPPVTAAPSERTLGTSRSSARVPLVDNRVPVAKGRLWSTATLKLRLEPREKARTAGLLKPGTHVAVSGRREKGYAEVIVNRTARWVTGDYLSKKKEKPAKAPGAVGVSNAPCPDGSSIEGGLQPAAIRTYRAVCNAFPELSAYGGQDGHGEHVNGQAIDFMVPSSSVGQRVADYLFAHRAEFDLFDIIWAQHIWTTQRSSEGFRSMSDRGSATANHYDHVHIMVN
jgi:hypothetical protein